MHGSGATVHRIRIVVYPMLPEGRPRISYLALASALYAALKVPFCSASLMSVG